MSSVSDCTFEMSFVYRNWQGEVAVRHVQFIAFWKGSTPFHPVEQWLMKAYDLDKKSERDFAVDDVIDIISVQVVYPGASRVDTMEATVRGPEAAVDGTSGPAA